MSIASLKDAVQYVRGVGPRRGEALARLGLREVWEVLWHAPRHYFDRSALAPLGSLVPGREVTVRGCLRRVALERTPRGFTLVKAWLQDETGSVLAVWFNQAYLVKVLRAGQCLYATGRVHLGSGTLELRVAEFEVEEGQQVLGAGRIVPVYPAGAGLSQKVLRQVASQVLETYADQWPEVLSPALRRQHGWPGSGAAFRALHFPESHDHLRRARERLAYEELVLWQWALLHRRERQRRLRPVGREQAGGDALVGELLARLPFTLTAAQRRVVEEIVGDLRAPSPMNRLLQGDVGSGKTVVAAIAAARTVGNGLQVAFMAPTEILAQQHFDTLSRLLQGQSLQHPGRHPRPHPGHGALRPPRAGGHRRAAPLRGAPAQPAGAEGRGMSGHPGDECHPHPQDPGHVPVRRHGRVGAGRAAARAQAGAHLRGASGDAAPGVGLPAPGSGQGAPGLHRVPAGGGVGGPGPAGGHRALAVAGRRRLR
ncbi:MAG: DEAD/DEAH box helicase [Syntrophomonadaceae bacterium]|nr:DEAD/DEAH box helicase [Syntrophomonadaceae bacterium]